MADTFKFEIVSPERLLLSEDVKQVVVPGSEGEFTVLPLHAPVISTLRPGVLEVSGGSGEDRRIFVRGGFAEVGPENLTVLAEHAIDLQDVDRDQLAVQITEAKEDLADAKTDEARLNAQHLLDSLTELHASL